jgi:signal transduction histidine kinase
VGENHLPNDEHASTERVAAAAEAVVPVSANSWRNGLRREAVANLAHELRTPVQVLLGYVDILRDDYGDQFSTEPRALLDRMNANAHDLAQTIDNLMHFVLSEVKAEVMIDEEVTPGSLIAEITPVLEAANQHKHLKLEFDFAAAPDLFCVPRRPLKAILLNLAVNAIKFTDSGAVTVALRSLSDSLLGNSIQVEITDTGPGLSPATLDHAVEPFAQLSNSSARRYRGLGLGLAVVQRSVEALGGKLELRPRASGGSNFLVTIPVRAGGNSAHFARAGRRTKASSIIPPLPSAIDCKPTTLR